jgi:hypothetical protein
MHRIAGVKERASHHPQHSQLIIHHEHDPGMRENLTDSHVAAPGRGELLSSVFPHPPYVLRG